MKIKDLFKRKEVEVKKQKDSVKEQDGEGDNIYIITDEYGEPLSELDFIEIKEKET